MRNNIITSPVENRTTVGTVAAAAQRLNDTDATAHHLKVPFWFVVNVLSKNVWTFELQQLIRECNIINYRFYLDSNCRQQGNTLHFIHVKRQRIHGSEHDSHGTTTHSPSTEKHRMSLTHLNGSLIAPYFISIDRFDCDEVVHVTDGNSVCCPLFFERDGMKHLALLFLQSGSDHRHKF